MVAAKKNAPLWAFLTTLKPTVMWPAAAKNETTNLIQFSSNLHLSDNHNHHGNCHHQPHPQNP
jgi:hypothetical protein